MWWGGVFGWDPVCSHRLNSSAAWKIFEGQSLGCVLEDVVVLQPLQDSSCWVLEHIWSSASTWASFERKCTPKPCREPNLRVVNVDNRDLLQNLLAGPDRVTGVGAAGGCCCWKAAQGWQQAVHYEMFIPALIMPFAASLCNLQLCVLQLA